MNDLLLVAAPIVIGGAAVVAWVTLKKRKRRAAVVLKETPVGQWVVGHARHSPTFDKRIPAETYDHPLGKAFEIPRAPSKINGAGFNPGSLAGKSLLRLTARIETDPGITVYPAGEPDMLSMIGMFIQEAGDDWDAVGKSGGDRWYHHRTMYPIPLNQDFVLEASLTDIWGSVGNYTNRAQPEAFAETIAKIGRVGFTLGGGSEAQGHGLSASGRAVFIIRSFEIE